jgi:hypothetical protein
LLRFARNDEVEAAETAKIISILSDRCLPERLVV